MGGTGSKAIKRISSIFGGTYDDSSSYNQKTAGFKSNGASPFVLTRKGSMYIDEDGDVAHEFYEETTGNGQHTATMRRITTNLTPQGEVLYEQPRLNVDLPVVLCEM